MNRIVAGALALMLAAPSLTVAQAVDSSSAVRDSGGVRVAGWAGRLDPSEIKAGAKLSSTSLVTDGAGIRVITGPGAIYWNEANKGAGTYTAKASFAQSNALRADDYYGLFVGGSELGKPNQNYLYCAISSNGTFVVKHRLGDELHDLAGRTAHSAIRRADGAGKAANEVAWKVASARTSCWVNGAEVWSYAGKDLVGVGKLESLDGIAGIRVGRILNLHISGFGVAAR